MPSPNKFTVASKYRTNRLSFKPSPVSADDETTNMVILRHIPIFKSHQHLPKSLYKQ